MFSEDISILSSKFLNFEYKMDFPLDFKNNQDIENRFNKNFFSQSEEEEEIDLINDDNTNTINSSIFSTSQMMPLMMKKKLIILQSKIIKLALIQ